jgi:hypothetical protein
VLIWPRYMRAVVKYLPSWARISDKKLRVDHSWSSNTHCMVPQLMNG